MPLTCESLLLSWDSGFWTKTNVCLPPQFQTFPRVVGAAESPLSANRARTIKAVRLRTAIADVLIVCHVLPMSTQEFVSQQRNAVNFLFGMIMVCLLMLWLWAALDWAFALGWNADPQLLWAAPLMAIFAYGLRFFCIMIFGFVARNY